MTTLRGSLSIALLSLVACGGGDDSSPAGTGAGGAAGAGGGVATGGTSGGVGGSGTAGSGTSGSGTGGSGTAGAPSSLPAAGNPDGACPVPGDGALEDVSTPTTVVGTGTAASCTGAAFVAAVAKGGVVTFDCGADPVTITLTETAKVFNDKLDAKGRVVIDGGGKVTLSGGGSVRILYQNACDKNQTWTTSHCNDQDTPKLTVQNLTFMDGNAKGLVDDKGEPQGGGAIYALGGRLKVINSRFFRNACDDVGPDVGGASIRAFQQSMGLPIYVVKSTFGGSPEVGNACSNGAGLSSIGVSWTVLNSLFTDNKAIGMGANPTKPPAPGGGSGGAIYNDGNAMTLSLCGVKMTNNTANEGGGAIFFVSNDGSGHMTIDQSVLTGNPSGKFETMPGIYYKSNTPPTITASTIAK